jgi:hypothetical protein
VKDTKKAAAEKRAKEAEKVEKANV